MNEPEGSSTKYWPENRLENLYRSLRPLCLKYLKATHLLPNLPFLRQKASRIIKTERKSPEEAVQLMFDLISDCNEPEKWKKFTEALKNAEFTSLYKICETCENNDFEFYIEIFELLSVDFAESGVNIMKLSELMLQHNFTQNQFERIKFIQDEEGEIAAILEFISCLISNIDKWIKDLLACLYILEKRDLSLLIKKKGNEIEKFNSMDLGHSVNLYRKKITERVRPQDIKIHLRTNNLITKKEYSSSIEEMDGIISDIKCNSEPGKWRSFVDALKQEGYESLYMMITDEGNITEDSEYVERIKIHLPVILQSLDVTPELLAYLGSRRLINKRCQEEIKQEKTRLGAFAAAEMVLDSIHRFNRNWFHIFLEILETVRQKELVKMIEPDYQFSQSTSNIVSHEVNFQGTSTFDQAIQALQRNPPVSSREVKNKNPVDLTITEEELLTAADKKKNCIIYINSRRNILAKCIIKNHLRRNENNKVVFLGSDSSLKFQNHLLQRNYQISNCENNVSLKNELIRNQIVLLTPEALKKSSLEKSFTYFSLLIIDECHLTIKDHPYNNVMKKYIDSKLDNPSDPLPQIIGLTSSLSHEKPKDMIQADEPIKMICGNLDCEEICVFQDGSSYFAFQIKEFTFNRTDGKNPFKEKVDKTMCQIENHLLASSVPAKAQEENRTLFDIIKVHNSNRDGFSYAKWLADFKSGFSSLNDSETRFHCFCYWFILNALHEALEIGTYCEIKPAFDYVERKLSKKKANYQLYESLFKYWDDIRYEIIMVIQKGNHPNPHLELVKKTIKEEIKNNPFSRIVVFVKTSILVNIIMNWMMDDDELRALLPFYLHTSKGYGDELYRETIETFNRRESQLCVVILEDWDQIEEKYNLKLDYYDNKEISSKGNFHDNSAQMEVNDGNSNPEHFLHNSMMKWKDFAVKDSEEFQKEIRKYQTAAKSRRSKKEDCNQYRPLRNEEFELRCKHCNEFACFSSEIRLFEGERFFVFNPNFIQKVNVKNEIISDSNKKQFRLIRCINCCREWGKIMNESLKLPELKINSFTIGDISKRIVSVEKWDKVPFFHHIQKATEEELEKMIHKS